MNKKKIFRTNWLIYPKFQLLLIAVNTLIVTVGFAFVTLGLKEFFYQLHKTGNDSGLSPNHYYFTFLGNQSSHLYWMIAAAWMGSVLVCAVVSLLLSHKIVGPIVRLRSYMNGIAAGSEKNPLKFRENDFFSDLPESVNQAFQKSQASEHKKAS